MILGYICNKCLNVVKDSVYFDLVLWEMIIIICILISLTIKVVFLRDKTGTDYSSEPEDVQSSSSSSQKKARISSDEDDD